MELLVVLIELSVEVIDYVKKKGTPRLMDIVYTMVGTACFNTYYLMIEYVNNGMYIEFEGRTYFVLEPVDVELYKLLYPIYGEVILKKNCVMDTILFTDSF